jgi:hypothetical protein
MMETIYASEIVGCRFCVSSEDGQKLYEAIKNAMRSEMVVSVSFKNAVDISSAFLDAAIGQLHNGDFSEEELKERLNFQDLSEEDLFILKRIILRSKYYCQDPQRADVVMCELLGEDDD